MPAQYGKAYIKRNKHDAADAEAICEAVVRLGGLHVDDERQPSRFQSCSSSQRTQSNLVKARDAQSKGLRCAAIDLLLAGA